MSHFTKVYYELSEAIEKAAEQNYQRDYRHGLEAYEKLADAPEDVKQKFLEEATYLLNKTFQNWEPEYPDDDLICVRREGIEFDNQRSKLIDGYYLNKSIYLGVDRAVAKAKLIEMNRAFEDTDIVDYLFNESITCWVDDDRKWFAPLAKDFIKDHVNNKTYF